MRDGSHRMWTHSHAFAPSNARARAIASNENASIVLALSDGAVAIADVRARADVTFVARGEASAREARDACAWSASDENLVYVSRENVVEEFDVRRGMTSVSREETSDARTRTFIGNRESISGIALDGDDLAACDDGGETCAYDARASSSREINARRRMFAHAGCATSIAFRRRRGGQKECLTSGTDCAIMKWAIDEKNIPIETWDAREFVRVNACETHSSDDSSAMARSFNPPMAHSVATWSGTTSASDETGLRRVAVAALGDGTVVVFDADSRRKQKSNARNRTQASARSIFPLGARSVALVGDASQGVGAATSAHANCATCADFAPMTVGGEVVISGGLDRRLIAWNWVAAATGDDERASALGSVAHARKIDGFAFHRSRPGVMYVIDTSCVVTEYVVQ